MKSTRRNKRNGEKKKKKKKKKVHLGQGKECCQMFNAVRGKMSD